MLGRGVLEYKRHLCSAGKLEFTGDHMVCFVCQTPKHQADISSQVDSGESQKKGKTHGLR